MTSENNNPVPGKRRSSLVDHARHDPATALASLFRPISKGRRPGGIEVNSEFDGLELKFMVWRALDTRDQSLLLAIIGLAGISRERLDPQNAGERGQQLWLDLDPQEQAKFDRATIITTSRYNLLKAANMPDTGRYYGMLEESLNRLSMVGCRAKKDSYQWSMQMLSYAEAPDGQINIALNSRFATALGGQFVWVSLDERHQLNGDIAQVTHGWLSAWLKQGRTQSIGADKLVNKVWGTDASPSTARKRRQRLMQALDEISALPGWRVRRKGIGAKLIIQITRPKILEKI